MHYLHIGIPRTASTFLQNVFFPALEGVHFVQDPQVMDAVHDCVTSQQLSAETKRILDVIGEHSNPVLISSEAFSMEPWTQAYPSETLQLRDWMPDARVIVFLRDPIDWVMSLYRLAVQKRRFVSLEEFVGWDGSKFGNYDALGDRKSRLNIKAMSFVRLLQLWNEGFSRERVHVFFYENFMARPHEELRRLCDLLGAAFPANCDPTQRRNRSLPAERCDAAAAAYAYLGRLDKYTKPWRFSHKFGPYVASNIAKSRIPFPKSLVRTHRDEIRAALESEIGDDRSDVATMYSDCPW